MAERALFDDLDTLTAPFGSALDPHFGPAPSRTNLYAGTSFGRPSGGGVLAGLLAGLDGGGRPNLLGGVSYGRGTDLLGGVSFGRSTDLFGGVSYGGGQSSGGGGLLGGIFSGLGSKIHDLFAGAFDKDPNKPATPNPPPGGGVTEGSGGPSSGMSPGVAKWAGQAQQTFGGLVDPDVMLAIMQNESGGDPNAYNGAGDAWGLFQQVGLGSSDPNTQFAAARKLAEQKLAQINASYAAHGLSPDERTRARDFALAWAGHFDYDTGQPNPASRDVGSGQTAQQLADIFLANYDRIKAGRTAGGAGGDWGAGLIGTPYAIGGLRTHPDNPGAGLDCSEFTAYVWGQKGVTLPWNAQQQYNQTARIEANQLQPGDLVFFRGTNPADPDDITHVGIYVGGGRMINAQDNGVQYADLNSAYWQQHLAGYGRVSQPTGGGGANYR
jgi:cell wall-associated NlpC family hydrolase